MAGRQSSAAAPQCVVPRSPTPTKSDFLRSKDNGTGVKEDLELLLRSFDFGQ